MDPRELADVRRELFQLRSALGAGTPDAAEGIIRRLVGAVESLQARVSALETWAKTVTPPGP